jgi:hypothetical protein
MPVERSNSGLGRVAIQNPLVFVAIVFVVALQISIRLIDNSTGAVARLSSIQPEHATGLPPSHPASGLQFGSEQELRSRAWKVIESRHFR